MYKIFQTGIPQQHITFRGFPTRTVHLDYISCLRYTILVGNPRFHLDPLTCLKGFAYWRRVSRHHVVRQWGGEMCHVSRAHTLETHARQHISSACSTFPYMEGNLSQWAWSVWLVSLQTRAYLTADWLSMVLWCDDSKPKRPGLNWCVSRCIHIALFL